MSGAVSESPAIIVLLAVAAVSLGAWPAAAAEPSAPASAPAAAGRAASPAKDTGSDLADQQQYAIPTHLDRIGRIIAPVMINGRGPFRFMLDTGATRTVLAESALAKLDRVEDPDGRVPISGIAGSELAPTVHVDSLEIGDLHFHDLDLPVLSGPVLYGIDGILGMDGFDGMKVSADFEKDRVTVSRSTAQPPGGLYPIIQVEFVSYRLLMINAHVGRVPVKAVIDTGGTRTIGNPALLAALIKGRQDSVAFKTDVVDATQMWKQGMMGEVPGVQLGNATISNLDVTFGDFQIFKTWGLEGEPALLIGMDVLGTLQNLTIDYRRKEVVLQAPWMMRAPTEQHWHSLTYW
jgi:predicted aspartyl protease